MQENRPFDHYYGTMRGVRGFNDRAAPLLPSGKSVWYQPTAPPTPTNASLCGCGACDLKWKTKSSELQALLSHMECPIFVSVLEGSVPPVTVSDGELCSTLLKQMLNTRFAER